ncbi:MAG: hypothetical protein A3G60_03555 [Candidatus Ryanbacteria bacterium RIFCSPLOWO2_12_FULL_47_9c]|uniref:DUF5666 domain-containing protein n=1 Tax=Candidatus Ryanbacteria bacterium RIFCSPLOWO2_12_FULL_47_9c TaxID=1802131 RepID=A0A1G2H3B8_9BACT|nr:MAG: hypothetical protein UY14_C0017G0014 [Parcubacteria group bacterium GW2011_GWA1_47_9]OGZ49635.1 MAG: hypothetical protein A3C83_01190 [Candidatus Ryanbacteria bacterium RIFCSPHIGHO2_02_FULL_47_25]OGZ56965.1 MAG: hypothetical protein A3G60_03555 [Candidatus Ryanbacteria bacterium RIFCSPLOWO2_12_FULL_47_9c]
MNHITKQVLVGAVALAMVAPLAFADTNSSSSREAQGRMNVVIGPAGHALVRGTVESVSANSLTVKSWGGSWIIRASADTSIAPRFTGSVGDLAKIQVGDFVGASGKVATNQNFTIDAANIRNWSERKEERMTNKEIKKQERESRKNGIGKIFVGIASSIGADTFVLSHAKATSTVHVSSDTKIVNRNWAKILLGDIAVHDRVRVFGTKANSDITAQVVSDISLPR